MLKDFSDTLFSCSLDRGASSPGICSPAMPAYKALMLQSCSGAHHRWSFERVFREFWRHTTPLRVCVISFLLGEMASSKSVAVALVIMCSMLCAGAVAQDFDFFYFVQQWPGSYCDTSQGCCFPLSSSPKPVFGIHGLWPNFNDGSYPSSCGNEPYNPQEVAGVVQQMDDEWGSLACPSSDSQSFWNHEWSKHGTCSGLSQHDYFQSAIDLYGNYDITAALANAGIVPDGSQYQIEDIRKAIGSVLDGHLPGVDCNKDEQGNKQLYQVYICVATDASTLIECPIFPSNECRGSVEFPVFDPAATKSNL